MVFDILIIASVVGAVWWWQQRPLQARHARVDDDEAALGYDDLPPIGAFDPLPDESGMDDYVKSGLQQLSHFLTGRDQNA
jgi:hypothetical protein